MALTEAQLKTIAEKYFELFEKYSKEPIAIDRLDPAYRVGTSELFDCFPELNLKLPDMLEILDYIMKTIKEMERRQNHGRQSKRLRQK